MHHAVGQVRDPLTPPSWRRRRRGSLQHRGCANGPTTELACGYDTVSRQGLIPRSTHPISVSVRAPMVHRTCDQRLCSGRWGGQQPYAWCVACPNRRWAPNASGRPTARSQRFRSRRLARTRAWPWTRRALTLRRSRYHPFGWVLLTRSGSTGSTILGGCTVGSEDARRRRTVTHAEAQEDRPYVKLDGVERDEEPRRDLVIRGSVGEEPEYL